MPKYYTPTQDEFFDGFQFQKNIDNEWTNGIQLYTLKDPVHLESYRVKYLDIDDIKDLGFTIKHEVPDEYTVLYKNIIAPQPFYYVLIFREENGLPFIELNDMYNHPLMAKIHIKNRNELEWLLNRYGIL